MINVVFFTFMCFGFFSCRTPIMRREYGNSSIRGLFKKTDDLAKNKDIFIPYLESEDSLNIERFNQGRLQLEIEIQKNGHFWVQQFLLEENYDELFLPKKQLNKAEFLKCLSEFRIYTLSSMIKNLVPFSPLTIRKYISDQTIEQTCKDSFWYVQALKKRVSEEFKKTNHGIFAPYQTDQALVDLIELWSSDLDKDERLQRP